MLNAEEGFRPLVASVQVLQPECQCVFNSMLSNWYLVKDRQCEYTYWLLLQDNVCALAWQDWHIAI